MLACAADAEEQEDVRGEAIEGLAKHLDDDSVGADLRAKAEDLMIDLLRSASPVLRFWSCFGLGTLGCQRAVPHLHEVSQKDPDLCPGWWYIREEAEDALEWIAGRPTQDRIPIHMRKPRTTEPGTAPNGGPAPPLGNSRVTKGPPSVS
ncbi:MAG: HEAT repeat domain-containing protein [Verrucomicrobia bacterium]|nr:HEAT repeat domain-containing protein [Verrucomicrobiota bacterium]